MANSQLKLFVAGLVGFGIAAATLPVLSLAQGQSNSTLANPAYNATGGSGTDITVQNIDYAIDQLKTVNTKNAVQTSLVLALLKGAGKPAGDHALKYHVTISPQGSVVVNDIDINQAIALATGKFPGAH